MRVTKRDLKDGPGLFPSGLSDHLNQNFYPQLPLQTTALLSKAMPYVCPICTSPLHLHSSGKSYLCANQHQFDIAKQGYLNLLPVQHKNSKQPGDNKEMIQARQAFLEAGYYKALAYAIAKLIDVNSNKLNPIKLLDLGCGEGYYSRQLASYFMDMIALNICGVDISKVAIAAAAKKQALAKFIVASANRLPYADDYFDVILRVFAPGNSEEISRTLKPSGLLVTVTPGPRHLWQLKQYIYAEVKEHPQESSIPNGFEPVATQHLHYNIAPNNQQRLALLQMTPFAWRVSPEARQAIQNADNLNIDADFILTLSQKLSDA